MSVHDVSNAKVQAHIWVVISIIKCLISKLLPTLASDLTLGLQLAICFTAAQSRLPNDIMSGKE